MTFTFVWFIVVGLGDEIRLVGVDGLVEYKLLAADDGDMGEEEDSFKFMLGMIEIGEINVDDDEMT